MKKIIFFVSAIFLIGQASASFATQGDNYYGTLNSILQYSRQHNPEKAKQFVTSDSAGLFDRIYKHKLFFLLPQNVNTGSKYTESGFDYVEFSDPQISKDRYATLAFKQDGDSKKLDLPETFRIAFGDSWKETLNTIESTYMLVNQMYGTKQSEKFVKSVQGLWTNREQ
ncbi:MAG: hypothetical protein COV35_05580 [Alphaproteobacteria bacterium CG11_big_fil_rev_8_21_14_0_20_39_49]|nr:MAG: hypothetical protein COV35_05580 [Alphaproteobacteria bacterium CG11_big_fil_rev_8_21_14_0_20_39_49]